MVHKGCVHGRQFSFPPVFSPVGATSWFRRRTDGGSSFGHFMTMWLQRARVGCLAHVIALWSPKSGSHTPASTELEPIPH